MSQGRTTASGWEFVLYDEISWDRPYLLRVVDPLRLYDHQNYTFTNNNSQVTLNFNLSQNVLLKLDLFVLNGTSAVSDLRIEIFRDSKLQISATSEG